ncbi:MAG TPA: PepSY-associated TM helix domain-containing protein [Burkholderiaceae bacterium]
MNTDDTQQYSRQAASRARWLKNLHQWHWISSAVSLLGILLFSFTGITLNHATQIEAKPAVTRKAADVPAAQMPALRALAASHDGGKAVLPSATSAWLEAAWNVKTRTVEAEWSQDEAYVALPRPGGDAWVRVNLEDGKAEYELTDRGWISWLNDLHKGRHTGVAWSWFIDIFAVACLLFALTGLLILKFHAQNRPSTWPVVGLGVLLPVLLAILFIH